MAAVYRIDKSFDHALFNNSSCAFGVFDGVHKGHQFLLNEAICSAQESGGKSAALTFDIDPDELFDTGNLKKLLSNDDRIALLANSGVDAVFVLPFSLEFASHAPEQFLQETFGDCAPAYIHVGEDLRFGCKASGSVDTLRNWSKTRGTHICAYQLEQLDGEAISATRIRRLLAQGDIEKANHLLGRNYYMRGLVCPGRGEGADMGFRTANMKVPDHLRALGDGVYAAYVEVKERRYKAAVNVGVAPMFERASATVEAHILDFNEDIYNQEIKVEFTNWLRPMMTFDSVETLIATVNSNIKWVRENL